MMGKSRIKNKPYHWCKWVICKRNNHHTLLINPVCEKTVYLGIHELPDPIEMLVWLHGTHCPAPLTDPMLHHRKDQIHRLQPQVLCTHWRLMLFNLGCCKDHSSTTIATSSETTHHMKTGINWPSEVVTYVNAPSCAVVIMWSRAHSDSTWLIWCWMLCVWKEYDQYIVA